MDFTYQPVERYRAIMALLFLKSMSHEIYVLIYKCSHVNAHEMLFMDISLYQLNLKQVCLSVGLDIITGIPFPDMPILGSSNSAANKDMRSKIWTNGDTSTLLSRKRCGKRRNCFQKQLVVDGSK